VDELIQSAVLVSESASALGEELRRWLEDEQASNKIQIVGMSQVLLSNGGVATTLLYVGKPRKTMPNLSREAIAGGPARRKSR
jgi:hypothetical protein